MRARLVSLGDHPDIVIVDVLTVIGRNRLCNVRVESGRISRRHCCLALINGVLTVRDLCSTNGTFVNGLRIEDGFLQAGEELAIANLRYRFEIEGDDFAATNARCNDSTQIRGFIERNTSPDTNTFEISSISQ